MSMADTVREGTLFCLGNPLLDISAEVDQDFLDRYELKNDDAILAGEKHKSMFNDLVQQFPDSVEYVPGGASQNTARIVQWLIGTPNVVTYMGCIGKGDKYGKILMAKARDAGVNVQYQTTEKEPTGTCGVLITGKKRSLVAYLAAANCFSKDHLEVPKNKTLMQKARYYYISGYPLTVCPDAMLMVARHAAANDRVFSMNLSAPFICTHYKDKMDELMPYVDILFGNESEAEAFADAHKFGVTDQEEIALRIARLPKENGKVGRIVVITQGADPVIAIKDGKVTKHPVVPIKAKDIIDTNGAGDAFVGGFLAQLIQGKDLDECIRCANYAANEIIRRSGCTYPEKPSFQ